MLSMAVQRDMALYYRERAAYYERVYHQPERQDDLRRLEASLAPRFAGRRVLEVACGTGWWTPHAARDCADWLATDLNTETLAIARAKPMPPGKVRFAQADAWQLDRLAEPAFDAAFAGCWWSHVPLQRLPAWLAHLHQQLAPGARVVLLDNSRAQTLRLPISRQDEQGNTYQLRSLDDGSQHEVLKNFPTRDIAIAQLGERARAPEWTETAHYWVLSYTLG